MPLPTATAAPLTIGARLRREKDKSRRQESASGDSDVSSWFKRQFPGDNSPENEGDADDYSTSSQPRAADSYYQQLGQFGPETKWLADTNSNLTDANEGEEEEALPKPASNKSTGEKLKAAKEMAKGQAEKAAGKSIKMSGKAAKKAGGAVGKAGGWLAGGAVGGTAGAAGGAIVGGTAGLMAGGVGAIPGAMAGAAEGGATGSRIGAKMGGKAGEAIGKAPGAATEKAGEAMEKQGQRTFNKGLNRMAGGLGGANNKDSGQKSQLERAKNAAGKIAKGDLLKGLDEAATVATKAATAGPLTGLWAGVGFDFTLMTLFSLHIYLFSSLINNKMAQFGEDYAIGHWIPDKQFAKWTEVLLLFVLDVMIISLIVTILVIMWAVVTYIYYHSWSAAGHFGWGWLFGGGGLSAVFQAALQSAGK
ncbi:MAG: hypothetical protein WC516_00365 [Patescibacteria group bacterium]